MTVTKTTINPSQIFHDTRDRAARAPGLFLFFAVFATGELFNFVAQRQARSSFPSFSSFYAATGQKGK